MSRTPDTPIDAALDGSHAHKKHGHADRGADDKGTLNIVGGGISGLTAAYYALKRGVPPENIKIYESSGRAGGQIRSDKLQGKLVNKGAEFIDSDQVKMLELCEELGVKLKASDDQGTLRFQLPNGKVLEGEAFLTAYRPIADQIIAHKQELKRDPNGPLAKRLETMSMDAYMNELVANVPKRAAEGRTWARWSYEVATMKSNRINADLVKTIKQAYASEAGNNPETINARMFVNEASGAPDGILASDCAFRVEGGTEKIIEALQEELTKRGVEFHAHSPVKSVSKEADGKIHLHIDSDPAQEASSDKVIFAVPTYALSKIEGLDSLGFSEEARLVIGDAQYTNSIKFTVALKDGQAADSANFFSAHGYQCWSADPGQITFLCNADDVTSGKMNMKSYIDTCLYSYAEAHGHSKEELFDPISTQSISLSNPGKSPCYASPAPGQLHAMDALGSSLDTLASNGVGVAGTYIPHMGSDGLGIGFMECGLYSADHACEMLMTKEQTREPWVERAKHHTAGNVRHDEGHHDAPRPHIGGSHHLASTSGSRQSGPKDRTI